MQGISHCQPSVSLPPLAHLQCVSPSAHCGQLVTLESQPNPSQALESQRVTAQATAAASGEAVPGSRVTRKQLEPCAFWQLNDTPFYTGLARAKGGGLCCSPYSGVTIWADAVLHLLPRPSCAREPLACYAGAGDISLGVR